MPAYPDHFVTELLPVHDMERAMRGISAVLQSLLGKVVLDVKYGWGCELHPKLCHVVMEVGTAWLHKFIDDSLRQQIVLPCDSDLYINTPGGGLEIVFCHEGHVHSGGNDSDLEYQFWSYSPFSELRLQRMRQREHDAT